MIIDQYYNQLQDSVSFTREQASTFAKNMAQDFNPLHDVDAKRFCVPGDLLFSVILARYGISRHMAFVFSGMVVDGIELLLPQPSEELQLRDRDGREYLSVKRSGDTSDDAALIQNVTQSYVEFSGQTFPHILVPLLTEKSVMINPDRPIVIYASMVIDLDRLDIERVVLERDYNQLEVNGKRGSVELAFNLCAENEVVGRGRKHIVLSGLREFDEKANLDALARYDERRRNLAG
ncbi:MAG: DUF3581 family protein [Halioglobus sp.]|nr:DUF3581 family protein [Halioglobus sp.]